MWAYGRMLKIWNNDMRDLGCDMMSRGLLKMYGYEIGILMMWNKCGSGIIEMKWNDR